MNEQKKTNQLIWIVIPIVGIAVIAGAIYAVINRQTPEDESLEQAEAAVTVVDNPLGDIIKSAKSWGPAFKPWFGRTSPEFTVTDIDVREHSLSSYRGRNVLVVFWATWCPACKLEIPHLIELRKEIGEEELAIIAISNESSARLKAFVSDKGINYSVASATNALPSPFGDVTSIPTTFFIDRNGQIKLVAVGLVELDDAKKILETLG
jgi:peroxiredoxin